MMPQNRIKATSDAFVASMHAIIAIYFCGLLEPWIQIACGLASALSLNHFNARLRNLVFIAVTALSFFESAPWFLGKNTLIFGSAGFVGSITLSSYPIINTYKVFARIIQVMPLGIILAMMPILAAISSPEKPRRAILKAGVWATVSDLPKGQEALTTKHQYTYEILQKSLGAKIISPNSALDSIEELIIITPTTPFQQDTINSICEWTKRGGRLIIVADHTNLFGHQTVLQKLTEKFGIGIRPDALFETETNGGIYHNFFTEFAGLTPCSISQGVIPRLKMNSWSENPDYTASSFFGELDPTNDDRYGHYPLLGSRRYGLGEVSVFTDSTFFANFAISRWSSQTLLASLLWTRESSFAAIIATIFLISYIFKTSPWLLLCSGALTILSPSLGFSPRTEVSEKSFIVLNKPDGVANDSEERDKGTAAALLASSYAFGVKIKWDKNCTTSFKEHIQKYGIPLEDLSTNNDKWHAIPKVETKVLNDGKFYIDQNSFWFSQGAGLIRTANMANFWRSLGAEIEFQHEKLVIIEKRKIKLKDSESSEFTAELTILPDNWVIIDDKIVAKWIPESSKWLARKEWQLGSWFKNDLIFEPVTSS